MNKDYIKGSVLILVILSLFGIVFAVGFHTADEIMSGSFVGNFDFSGATVTGLSGGGVEIDSSLTCNVTNHGKLKYNSTLNKFYGCDGTNWREISLGSIEDNGGGNDEYTKLLLHCDDLTDSSVSSHTITNNGGVSVNGFSKFGSSCYFDGVNDYLSLSDNNDWTLGSGDFTIDFWMYTTGINDNYQTPFYHWVNGGGANRGMHLQIAQTTGDLGFNYGYDGDNNQISLSSSTQIVNNQWYHIAIIKEGSVAKMYLDGSLVATDTSISGTPNDPNVDLRIGNSDINYYFEGYIDELRVSKGIARWGAPFTPPTGPYS